MRVSPVLIAIGVLLLPHFALVSSAQASDAEARIAKAFQRLGMDREESECYGSMIDKQLDSERSEQAASIVESAKNGSEVRTKVRQAGSGIMQAFALAHTRCGS